MLVREERVLRGGRKKGKQTRRYTRRSERRRIASGCHQHTIFWIIFLLMNNLKLFPCIKHQQLHTHIPSFLFALMLIFIISICICGWSCPWVLVLAKIEILDPPGIRINRQPWAILPYCGCCKLNSGFLQEEYYTCLTTKASLYSTPSPSFLFLRT